MLGFEGWAGRRQREPQFKAFLLLPALGQDKLFLPRSCALASPPVLPPAGPMLAPLLAPQKVRSLKETF